MRKTLTTVLFIVLLAAWPSASPAEEAPTTPFGAEAGPNAWEDDTFGVRLAFFSRTDADTRMRILVGRRGRLEERVDNVRTSLSRTRERLDGYTLELQQHGLESVEREVRWLNELIADEHEREQNTGATQHAPAVTKRAAGTSPNDRVPLPGDTQKIKE